MTKHHAGPREYLSFLAQVAHLLDPNFVKEAADFEHGQWELPFEATLLNLIKISRQNVNIDLYLVEKLAKDADLIEEGVIDPDTWKKFLNWSNIPTN